MAAFTSPRDSGEGTAGSLGDLISNRALNILLSTSRQETFS